MFHDWESHVESRRLLKCSYNAVGVESWMLRAAGLKVSLSFRLPLPLNGVDVGLPLACPK
jgi:hypothetical protein